MEAAGQLGDIYWFTGFHVFFCVCLTIVSRNKLARFSWNIRKRTRSLPRKYLLQTKFHQIGIDIIILNLQLNLCARLTLNGERWTKIIEKYQRTTMQKGCRQIERWFRFRSSASLTIQEMQIHQNKPTEKHCWLQNEVTKSACIKELLGIVGEPLTCDVAFVLHVYIFKCCEIGYRLALNTERKPWVNCQLVTSFLGPSSRRGRNPVTLLCAGRNRFYTAPHVAQRDSIILSSNMLCWKKN